MSDSTERVGSCFGPLAFTLGLMILVTLLIALPWYAKWSTYQEVATSAAEQLARFESRLSRRPAIQQALTELQKQNNLQGSYIQGQTLGLAGANLQQMTKGLVETAGGALISSQIVTPPSEPPLQMLVNKVRMRADTEALLKLVHRVESGEPTLFLENLIVRGSRSRRRSLAELDIQFDLAGYTLRAETVE